ncbi:MAG TPA: methionyl-tRNA formyltransferase [Leptospiraceae bacterium]|nr:methionyl-tRNA formyltransferase [Leptospiraceae bacterium]HMX31649.1 methionyl-tRNA formyltransferase [Leptospiraceae bacterium]HMY30466.1 methionyl-tRNA formyltransferase [Leptospiraceae bacterium]HMZ66649.1 methionyl-tRNA formyltransferase [Leptospiraceae bacterium]HNA06473.1 methionyl-tRNA formyltransferase [Leptospiraceae bacterium]
MKIGYFGTPEHSAKLLEALILEGHQILFVATNQDKPVGRDKALTPSPVKKKALENNIPVLQFPNIRNDAAIEKINSFDADIYVVFAYGYIIPSRIFNHPKLGTINLHGSLLPEYRGASPVQSAILEGKTVTGVTIQYILEELDAGNIISQKEIQILKEDTFGTLLEKITNVGITEVIQLLKNPTMERFPSKPQNHSDATHCRKIKPEDRKLDFREDSITLFNKIRAFNPGYICYTTFREKRLNIYSTHILEDHSIEPLKKPGSVHLIGKKTIGVECGDSKILILESVQPENKKVMSSLDFINGNKPQTGEVFL